jgi:hypothetical protein
MPVINLIPGAISELTVNAYNTRRITKADRYGMMAAILDDSISEKERFYLDRLLLSIAKGRVQVTEELSVA